MSKTKRNTMMTAILAIIIGMAAVVGTHAAAEVAESITLSAK